MARDDDSGNKTYQKAMMTMQWLKQHLFESFGSGIANRLTEK